MKEKMSFLVEKQQAHTMAASKYKVLLVEDLRIIRLIHSNFLQTLDCFVDCAENGQQALEMLSDIYDIVFMDMGLPDIMGTDVVKSYRSHEKGQHLPIVALTAHGGKEDRKNFIASGIDEVLIKPVTIQQLSDTLKKHCEK